MKPIDIVIITIASVVGLIAILLFLIRLFSNKIFAHRVEGDVRFAFQSVRDFPNLKQDNVVVLNARKVHLHGGLYYYPNRTYKGVIIFYHGFMSGRLNYLNVIEFFARHNYQVLAFDFMGTMSSEGRKIRGMPNAINDARYIVQYAINNPKWQDLPIYTMGHSMGGYTAITSLLYDDNSRLKKSVAFCPYNSNVSCTFSFSPLLKMFAPLVYLYNLIFFGYTATYKVTDAIKYSDAKKMIICGGKDNIVKENYAYKKFKKIKDENLTLCYLKDADHFVYMSKEGADNFTAQVSFPRKTPIAFDKIKYDAVNSLNVELFDQILAFLNN